MILTRRSAIAGALVTLMPIRVEAQARGTVSLADLINLTKLVGDAADAVTKIGESAAKLARLSLSGWDLVQARQTRARLIEMSANLGVLAGANQYFVERLSDYPRQWSDLTDGGKVPLTPQREAALVARWQSLMARLLKPLGTAKSLLESLQRERSDFVLSSAYMSLSAALNGRVSLLSRLQQRGAPLSSQEIAELDNTIEVYAKLLRALRTSTEQVNVYVKSIEK